MRVITSFGPEGWETYGKRFLETFVEYWPCGIDVYYEERPDFDHPNVKLIDLLEDVDGVKNYLLNLANFPAFRGVVGNKRNYRYDIFRFCRKSFAQVHASTQYKGKIFWLDADVITHKKVPEEVLNSLLEDTYMCYLGRKEWHSCASFIGWDTAHEANKRFMGTYLNVYLSGDVFHLPEWHDSYIVDQVRNATNVPARNLTKDVDNAGPANIFNLSPIGRYAEHLKGNKKFNKEIKVAV